MGDDAGVIVLGGEMLPVFDIRIVVRLYLSIIIDQAGTCA